MFTLRRKRKNRANATQVLPPRPQHAGHIIGLDVEEQLLTDIQDILAVTDVRPLEAANRVAVVIQEFVDLVEYRRVVAPWLTPTMKKLCVLLDDRFGDRLVWNGLTLSTPPEWWYHMVLQFYGQPRWMWLDVIARIEAWDPAAGQWFPFSKDVRNLFKLDPTIAVGSSSWVLLHTMVEVSGPYPHSGSPYDKPDPAGAHRRLVELLKESVDRTFPV